MTPLVQRPKTWNGSYPHDYCPSGHQSERHTSAILIRYLFHTCGALPFLVHFIESVMGSSTGFFHRNFHRKVSWVHRNVLRQVSFIEMFIESVMGSSKCSSYFIETHNFIKNFVEVFIASSSKWKKVHRKVSWVHRTFIVSFIEFHRISSKQCHGFIARLSVWCTYFIGFHRNRVMGSSCCSDTCSTSFFTAERNSESGEYIVQVLSFEPRQKSTASYFYSAKTNLLHMWMDSEF